jgi:signal transduction histidine kinase
MHAVGLAIAPSRGALLEHALLPAMTNQVVANVSTPLESVPPTRGSNLRSAYRFESLDLCRRAARTACILWIAVTPAFVLTDIARFPDVAPLLAGIRALYVLANLGLLVLLARPVGARRPREIALGTTALGGLLVFAVMAFTGGHGSPYVSGMALLILGTALLVPWSPAWSILATALLLASYGAYALLADPLVGNVRLLVNNVVVFTAAGAIGAVSAVGRERLRWREFKNRFAFERTYAEKCASEAQLRLEAAANQSLIAALEQANQVRSEFVSTMSHELRTPLNVMLGLAEMARDPSFDSHERDEMLERLRRYGDRLLELVEGTLEIGKIEAGRTRIDPRPLSIVALWDELRRGCSDLMPRPGVVLEWGDAVPAGEVRTDPRKLLVVLRNLVGNALKFTDRGHVRVTLDGDAREVVLRVADSGVGIPPEDHELVFEMFRQGDSSETRRFDGCGLGLYIVKQFVLRLGGTVELSSEAGVGSTFAVTLPREPRFDDAVVAPPSAPPPVPAETSPAYARVPVLRTDSSGGQRSSALASARRSTGFAT